MDGLCALGGRSGLGPTAFLQFTTSAAQLYQGEASCLSVGSLVIPRGTNIPRNEPSNTHPLQEKEANKDTHGGSLGGNYGKQLRK